MKATFGVGTPDVFCWIRVEVASERIQKITGGLRIGLEDALIEYGRLRILTRPKQR
jgi:hypothetical protein